MLPVLAAVANADVGVADAGMIILVWVADEADSTEEVASNRRSAVREDNADEDDADADDERRLLAAVGIDVVARELARDDGGGILCLLVYFV